MLTKLYIYEELDWANAMLYKLGPQHDLDLVENDMARELKFARSVRPFVMSSWEGLLSSSQEEECGGNEYSNRSHCHW